MRFLGSVKLRIFLVCWIVFSVHFATNIVREHYPAFTLIENGDFVCDRYQGFHDDIFVHTDGHSYVGNNVLGSVIAAVPLLVFDPLLDALEAHSKRKLAESGGQVDTSLDSSLGNSRALFRLVREAGLDLRFGASAVITSAFLMAPLSALLAVLMYSLLLARGIAQRRATWLAFLFAFGTPVFFRTSHLNHNMFLMAALFGAFLLLWDPGSGPYQPSLRRRLWAGCLCGIAFALDYAGAIPASVLFCYFVARRKGSVGLKTALRESVGIVAVALPAVAFLLWSQWAMYGDPFAPGQFVMRPVNYTDVGIKGINWPTPEVFVKNLISPSYGLLMYAPLLAVGFLPAPRGRGDLVVPRRDRRWIAAYVISFLLFCAANTYSLMQFNSGFRYLLPIVPFLFLTASDRLARWSPRTLMLVTVPVLFHSWVLTTTRQFSQTEKELHDRAVELGVNGFELPGYWHAMLTDTNVPLSYRVLFEEGIQLPWLRVLQASPLASQFHLDHAAAPSAILIATAALCGLIWYVGARRARTG